MDNELSKRLTKLARQINILEVAEKVALTLDANEKTIFSKLLLSVTGSSISTREAKVYVSLEWREFLVAQTNARVEYNKAKRYYELLDKAYLAEHLTYKVQAHAIGRGVE